MSLEALARTMSEEVLHRPIPMAPIEIVLDEFDDPTQDAADHLGHAEGQSFLIEYRDSAGRRSARRITVWGIVAGANGVPSLIARCHERQAQRQFRIDRIVSVVDYDGEVFEDVPAFLVENFGMSHLLAGRRGDDAMGRDRVWSDVLEAIRHDAVILSALARSDGKAVAVEVDAAADHLSQLAERNGAMLDEAQILAIYRYANRLRPTEEAIVRALRFLQQQSPQHVKRLLIASAAIIDADGLRHPNEIALLNAVAEDLLGVPLV